jgi:L-lysine 2,3-aminomutase
MLLSVLAVAWLTITVLCVVACRMAARADFAEAEARSQARVRSEDALDYIRILTETPVLEAHRVA